MRILLVSEDRIRLEGKPGPMTVEADSPETQYSPFHMLASSLATCTFSVLASWGTHAKLGVEDLAVEVGWSFVEEPHRVGEMTIDIDWPSLPEARRTAAERVAALCTVKKTLEQPPEVHTRVKTAAAA
ncbi:MAG TPA: OsmC family protein [Longimicrobiaceae bacterium]|nr:OsmC family protein [Longimicrobiaceae bacterium]